MNRNVYRLLKDLGMHRIFIVFLILRVPFDFMSTVLYANMLGVFLRLIDRGNHGDLLPAFFLFLGLTALLFAYNMTVWCTISVRVNVRLQKLFRKRMLCRILGAGYEKIQQRSGGEWLNRLNSDIDHLHTYLMAPVNFMHLVIALVNVILSSIVLAFLNFPLLIVTMLVLLPFSFLSCIVVVRKIPFFKHRAQEALGRYTNWAEPVVRARDAICIFGGEEQVLKKVEETSLDMLHANMQVHRRVARATMINTFSGMTGYLLLLLCGDSMMGTKIADIAALMKITQYRAGIMKSTMLINNAVNSMRSHEAGAVRACEVLIGEKESYGSA